MASWTQIYIPTPDGGSIPVYGEQTTEHFAITPRLAAYPGKPVRLDRGRSLVHIPSGRRITSDWYADLDALAAKLEALDIDWDGFGETPLTKDQAKAIFDLKREYWASDDSKGWPWPKWAGDESTPALSTIAESLDQYLDRDMSAILALGNQARAALPEDLGQEVDAHLLIGWSSAAAATYGVAYLLAVLHRIDPDAADVAARNLVAEWDAGDAMGERACEWRDALAKGEPLALLDFPSIEIPGGAA